MPKKINFSSLVWYSYFLLTLEMKQRYHKFLISVLIVISYVLFDLSHHIIWSITLHKQLNYPGYGYGWDTHNWQFTRDNWNIRVSNFLKHLILSYSWLETRIFQLSRVNCRLNTRVFRFSRVYCQLWVSHPYPYPYPRKFSCSCMITPIV